MIIRPKLEIDFSENLVGGFTPPEKYEFVNWDDDIPNMMGREK
jgi:hypothetical protein